MSDLEQVMKFLAASGYKVSVTCHPDAKKQRFAVCVYGRGQWHTDCPTTLLNFFCNVNRAPKEMLDGQEEAEDRS